MYIFIYIYIYDIYFFNVTLYIYISSSLEPVSYTFTFDAVTSIEVTQPPKMQLVFLPRSLACRRSAWTSRMTERGGGNGGKGGKWVELIDQVGSGCKHEDVPK